VSTLSTHVLDTSLGTPARGIRVTLERAADGASLGTGVTDADGRIAELPALRGPLVAGEYRLRFAVAEYFATTGRDTFYSEIVVAFRVAADQHYHVPLLLSPFGYATYRGS
jgi:5-hydroxyisourate hydrolase